MECGQEQNTGIRPCIRTCHLPGPHPVTLGAPLFIASWGVCIMLAADRGWVHVPTGAEFTGVDSCETLITAVLKTLSQPTSAGTHTAGQLSPEALAQSGGTWYGLIRLYTGVVSHKCPNFCIQALCFDHTRVFHFFALKNLECTCLWNSHLPFTDKAVPCLPARISLYMPL